MIYKLMRINIRPRHFDNVTGEFLYKMQRVGMSVIAEAERTGKVSQ